MNKDKIIELLKISKVPKTEIALACGVSRQSVYQWINHIAKPKDDDVWKKLNDVINNSIQEELINVLTPKKNDVKYVPILSYVQAGEFTSNYKYDDTDIDHIPLEASEVPNNAFLMRVRGDSMVYDFSPNQRLNMSYSKYNINEDELVLVDPSITDVHNLVGKVAVVHNGNGTTVKLVYQEENGLCLMPLNSRLQNNEDIKRPDEARIIGKVIKVINERSFS